MKNSAWYQKLWKSKLDELPLVQAAESSWLDMKELLDAASGTTPSKPLGAKIISFLTYILPVAAMIIGAVYMITIQKPIKSKTEKLKKDTLFQNPTLQENKFKTDSTGDSAPITGTSDLSAKSQSQEQTTQSKNSNSLISNDLPIDTDESPTIPAPSLKYDDFALPNKSYILLLNPNLATTIPEVRNPELSKYRRRNISTDTPAKKIKPPKIKKEKTKKANIPNYSYGITAGVNAHKNKTLYFGPFLDIKVAKQITANVVVQFHTPRTFTGQYNRASYYLPDSTPTISFTDTRKIAVIELPLTLTYHLTKKLNIKGGPVISVPLKQQGIKLGKIAMPRDTLFHGKQVIKEIADTEMKKINYGFKAGIGLQLNQVGIDLNYQLLNRYEFKNNVGSNKHSYNTIQLGISYRLNKK